MPENFDNLTNAVEEKLAAESRRRGEEGTEQYTVPIPNPVTVTNSKRTTTKHVTEAVRAADASIHATRVPCNPAVVILAELSISKRILKENNDKHNKCDND